MTETLKTLAEMFPEKFTLESEGAIGKRSGTDTPVGYRITTLMSDGNPLALWYELDNEVVKIVAGQDDIDGILAQIGWEYEVRVGTVIKDDWFSHAWRIGNRAKLEEEGYARAGFFYTKCEAAQAALQAVVEEIKKGEKE